MVNDKEKKDMAIAIYVVGIVYAVGMGVYFYRRLGKQLMFFGVDPKTKKARIGRAIFAAAVCAPGVILFSAWPLVMLVIAVLFLFTDICAFAARHLFKGKRDSKVYRALAWMYHYMIFALLGIGIYFGYGIYNMNRIVPAHYDIAANERISRDYRVVVIADTHYGTVQDESLFKNEESRINKLKPDIVILDGDITEEGTSRKEMNRVYETAAGFKARYGTYYIFGNHDKQHYTQNKTYTVPMLKETIRKNGIKVLEDKSVKIGKDMLLIGRADYSEPEGRKNIQDLIDESHFSKAPFKLVADHQPRNMDENARAGVDLQVSGHTHGGHVFPLGTLFDIVGYENYGEYIHGDMKLIVTSGFTGWGYPFRTQRHCEYAVIDIKNK